MNIEVFFPKDFVETERLQQAIKEVMAEGTYLFEEKNVRRDGSVFPPKFYWRWSKAKRAHCLALS